MKPDGVIAFHVTNRFLNLVPVVEALAHAHGLHVALDRRRRRGIAREPQRLGAAVRPTRDCSTIRDSTEAAQPIEPRRDWRLWTDDFNNLVQVLK